MKRLLCVVLALVFLSAPAMAEGLDLAGMDYDSLMQLKQAVEAELYSRPEAEPRVLQPGLYAVGRDIEPGSYQIIIASFGSGCMTWLTLYADEQKMKDKDSFIYWCITLGDDPIAVNLEVGTIVGVDGLPLLLSTRPITDTDYPQYTVPDGTEVPSGVYRGGTDIPVGSYQVYSATIVPGYIVGYENEEKYRQNKYIRDFTVDYYPTDPENVSFVEVTDGSVLIVTGNAVMIKAPELDFD